MRICTGCGLPKNEESFAWRNQDKGKRQNRCRDCQSMYHREWYEQNRERVARMVRQRESGYSAQAKSYVMEYLSSHPCVDCGETDPIVLDFDHRDGLKKRVEIGLAIQGRNSIAYVKDEVEKCDIRCANCHRRRHAYKSGSYRVRPRIVAAF